MSKRLGRIIGCKYKTSSWHLDGFPDGSNIGSTVLLFRSRKKTTIHRCVRPQIYSSTLLWKNTRKCSHISDGLELAGMWRVNGSFWEKSPAFICTHTTTLYCWSKVTTIGLPWSGFVFTAYVIGYCYYHVWWCPTLSLFLFFTVFLVSVHGD